MSRKLFAMLFTAALILVGSVTTEAQSVRKVAKKIKASIENMDLDGIMSVYADTVHYVDPNYGSDDHFSRATIRQFFAPMFVENSKFDLKILTAAVDEEEGSVIIRGTSYAELEKGHLPFIVFFKVENGKVIQQIDFPVYAVEALRDAPRYKGYFKEKGG